MNVEEGKSRIIRNSFGIVLLLLLAKLFHLQIIDKKHKLESNEISVGKEQITPKRGVLYDRNDSLLVYNTPVYDIYFILNDLANTDTTALCQWLAITKEYLDEQIAKAEEKQFFKKPFLLLSGLSETEFAAIQEDFYRYPAVQFRTSTERRYNYPAAALLLGYMGEVDEEDIEDANSYYALLDSKGVSGIEQSYEDSLRGAKGVRYVLKDNFEVIHGNYQGGEFDIPAKPGKDIYTTIDITLQTYGEKLMRGKTGSIVAIEPATGEILALISSPSYNPNGLVGKHRSMYFKNLAADSLKPLYNRAIQAVYPPGSTFKPLASLIAMEIGAVTGDFVFPCPGYYKYGPNGKPHCHAHWPVKGVKDAVRFSCNPYYAEVFRKSLTHEKYNNNTKLALNGFRRLAQRFGYDTLLQIGLNGVKPGFFPSSNYYDSIYKGWNWKPTTILSLSIGQGEILASSLQMANSIAVIANRGYYYTPHLVRRFSDVSVSKQPHKRIFSTIRKAHFQAVIDGMERTFIDGTAKASRIQHIAACGKTGTAENPHGKDHSLFVGFAPKNNPKIAVAVVVENAGFGAVYAAPIASLLMEKHIKKNIPYNRKYLETFILNKTLNGRDAFYIAKRDSLLQINTR